MEGYKYDALPDPVEMTEDIVENRWMFNGLQSAKYSEYRYEVAEEGKYSYDFPEADYVVLHPDGSEVYYIKDRDKWQIVGEASIQQGNKQPVIVHYQIPLDGCFPSPTQPRSFYGSPFEYVNTRGEKVQMRINIIDGSAYSGKLYLPEGVYDAYRVERSVTYDYDLSVADIFAKKAFVSYYFLDIVTQELLMEMRLDTDRSVKWIKYKSTRGSEPVINVKGRNQFALYPSTSFGDNLRLDFLNFGRGAYTFEVYNIMGKKMWTQRYLIDGDTTLKEDLSFLPRGTYIYTLLDSGKNRVITRRFSIIKA